jgi:DNA-binding CsgD family transcriptional regulator
MATVRDRALAKVARLTATSLDLVELWHASADVIAGAVAYDGSPCWYTLDPTSLLITSHVNADMATIPDEWLAAEYYVDDVNTLRDIARSAAGISTLHEACGGDPTSSPRWIENSKYGGDQEMIAALRSANGDTWGAIGLYRHAGRPLFDESDKAFVRAAARHLAGGARRALLATEAKEVDDPEAPGLLVLSPAWEVVSTTPTVERLVSDLPDGDLATGRLPASIVAVASRARAGEPDSVRLRSRSGRWLVVHAAPLAGPASERSDVAVIVEPAHPGRIAPLLMAAYGLTEREQEVTGLVLLGEATDAIAEALFISPHTVQEHLKRVFEKTGVRSRRDLVGKVFFSHYEPRVRDNEVRAAEHRPLRGDPFPSG